mmetsp:Transcript_22908/g.66124  ORF Transcript_22908/g.66124 Transcript_22908/m.66124 type:complete len:1094 (+) Transcript_22908:166-3447(+)
MALGNVMCYGCHTADVSDPSKRITFEPCGHSICYCCMIDCQVEHTKSTASIGKRLKCECGVKVDVHVWDPAGDGEKRIRHSDPKLDPKLDGARIWLKKVLERCGEHGKDHVLGKRGLLYTTQLSVPADGGEIQKNSFELSAAGEWLPNPIDGERCIVGCTLFHSATHPLSSTKRDPDDDRTASSIWDRSADDDYVGDEDDNDGNNGNSDDAIERPDFDLTDIAGILNYAVMEDNTLMPKLLYSLATGHGQYVMYTDEKGEPVCWGDPRIDAGKLPHQVISSSWRGAILASYGASGFLMRATKPNDEVGVVGQYLSDVVEYASPSTVRDVLSAFRIVTGRKHVLRGKAEAVIKKMLKGLELGPRDLILISADNVELKGKNGKFERFFALLHYIVTEDELIDMGIYTDDDLDAYAELAKSGDWLEFIAGKTDEEILDDVLRPGLEEFCFLGESFLSHVGITLEGMRNGDVPSAEDSQRMVETDQFIRDTKNPYLYRYSTARSIDEYRDNREREIVEEESLVQRLDGLTIDDKRPNIFEINRIQPSTLGHMSFGKKDCIFAIFEYMTRIGNNMCRKIAEDPEKYGHLCPPVSQFLRFMVGDGAPMCMGSSILDADVVADINRYAQICPLLGAFHFYMEVFKKANQYNEEMATFLASTWKGTGDISLKYYLNFSDPTNPEKEMSSMLLAIYSYAIRCMARAGESEVTAISVHEYMVKCAIECPAAMALLNLVLHYETTILARRAMRTNNFDLLISVIKLAMPILAATHCTNYFRILTDFLRRLMVMSKLERKLTEAKGFTGKTVNGSFYALDQIQEKAVGTIRKKCGGKVWGPGMTSKMEFAALFGPAYERAGDQNVLEQLVSGGFERGHNPPIGDHDYEVFAKVTGALEGSEILVPGSAIKVKGRTYDDPNQYLSPINGQPLLGELMRFNTTNRPKCDNYFLRYHIRTQREAYRSEKEMGIPITVSTSVGIAEAIKKKVTRATTLSVSTLKSTGTCRELFEELHKLERFLGEDQIPVNISPNSRKQVICQSIVRLRKRLTKDQLKVLKEEASRTEDMVTTVEQRSQTVEDKYYAFTNDIKDLPEFMEVYQVEDLNV